jgi:hypothetical protein
MSSDHKGRRDLRDRSDRRANRGLLDRKECKDRRGHKAPSDLPDHKAQAVHLPEVTMDALGKQLRQIVNRSFISGVTFGSAIVTPATPPINSFTLQKGIYQVSLFGFGSTAATNVEPLIVVAPIVSWDTLNFGGIVLIVGGDKLISVGDNTVLKFTTGFLGNNTLQVNSCDLVITKLQ